MSGRYGTLEYVTTTQNFQLPKIVQYLGRSDAGEYGADNCAHCGAKCRYQVEFLGSDGKTHRAAAGCIKLYPVSKVAGEHAAIDTRRNDREKKGQALASWDIAKLEAIEKFYAGDVTEDHVLTVILNENGRRSTWIRRNRGGR